MAGGLWGAFCVVWVCVDTRAYGGVFLWAVGGEALGVTFCCCSTLGRVDAGAMSLHVVGQGSSRSTRLQYFFPSGKLHDQRPYQHRHQQLRPRKSRCWSFYVLYFVGQGSTQLLSLPLHCVHPLEPPPAPSRVHHNYANCGYQNCIARRCDPVRRGHLPEFAISTQAFVW